MVRGNTKRIVVIKDIPSNIIEEAILILKNEPGTKNNNGSKEALHKKKGLGNDYLIKEAESVINNYIKDGKIAGGNGNQVELAPKIPKNRFAMNAVINTALIGSIALLIFLVSRFI